MFSNLSSIYDEEISRDDPLFWSRPSPFNCNTIRIIGIFLCLSSFVGIILNGSLFSSFIRYKDLRSPPNIFVMFLTGIGFVGSLSTLPLTGVSSIYCYWLFNRVGCQFEAVMAFLYGTSSSYLLCAVSLSRCYIIIRPFNAKDITVMKCVIFATISVVIAFLWTMFPLMGWNEYTMEGVRTSCCVNWYDRRSLYISFNLFLFAFVYLIPLIILLTTNTIIFIGLKRMRKKHLQGVKADLSQKKIEMEQRILKSIIITVCGFIFTWTPYAIVFFISAFRGKDTSISPLATFICACFAKSSVMWIPILYISTSTHFRLTFLGINSIDKQGEISHTVGGAYHPSIAIQNNPKTTQIPTNNPPTEKEFSPIDEH